MPDEPKPIPLGAPLPLSDDDLDEMSRVTPQDIKKAAAFWRAHVSPKFASLLDAQVEEDQEDATTTNQ